MAKENKTPTNNKQRREAHRLDPTYQKNLSQQKSNQRNWEIFNKQSGKTRRTPSNRGK